VPSGDLRLYQQILAEFNLGIGAMETLEEFCWCCYANAIRLELKGVRAEKVPARLACFDDELRHNCRLSPEIASALSCLREQLETLAPKKGCGRPHNTVGRLIQPNIGVFLPRDLRSRGRGGSFTVEQPDEIVNDILATILRRRV
jgi:hypothetical protein